LSKFWRDYPVIDREIEEVTETIKKNAKCKDKIIENSIIELVNSGGKMLRPAFTLIASRFGDYNKERAQALASVMEMFHMATLVHDDIIDEAKFRRGKETVQSKYGKNYAVYIGDYLFCICFRILATTSSIDRGIDVDTKVMSKICLGEINQLNSIFNKNLSIKEYFRIIAGKTAELFSLSFYIGAAESGCDKKICRLFWSIGHNIGMSFQNYLNKIRLEKSVNMVLQSDKNMTEIAIANGFSSTSYFYKVFKNEYNCTPLEYRKIFADKGFNRSLCNIRNLSLDNKDVKSVIQRLYPYYYNIYQ